MDYSFFLDYEYAGFSSLPNALSGHLPKNRFLIELPLLIKSFVFLGHRPSTFFNNGTYSLLEACAKIFYAFSYFKTDTNGNLIKTDLVSRLDPSEKGIFSYYTGMVFTRVISEKYFGVPFLLHYDLYSQEFVISKNSSMKPDFIGVDRTKSNFWIFEAKGSSHHKIVDAIKKGKNQVQSISSINKIKPKYAVVLQTFYASSGSLNVYFEDPEAKAEKNLEINFDASIRRYYEQIFFILNSNERSENINLSGIEYKILYIAEYDFSIGLEKELFDQFSNNDNFPSFSKLVDLIRSRQYISDDKKTYIGDDGIFVRLGALWDYEHFSKEPSQRFF